MTIDQGIRSKHKEGFRELNEFWDELEGLESEIEVFSETAMPFLEEPLERTLDMIRAFEPSVSVIGQIKAGKSTLMNAMIGETSLLPSDVNPWTSVITGVHVNSRIRPMDTRALFRFFDAEEWDRLVETGGRIGEMAHRAGFETEAEEVKSQVSEMRQSTEARLGDEFEKLLGSSRAFAELDKGTLDRYICYGDPEELAEGAEEGVYADLTKTADIFIDLPGYPRGLCLRDTPGVNDTFMMREQITLNAISESRVCVIVLSAHQALSTMDLGLLRIICSVEAREVLLFVNRIDELPDPAVQTREIEDSLHRVLSQLGLDEGIEILFGSGYWANFALGGSQQMLPQSRASLETLSEGADLGDAETLRTCAMKQSGVTELLRAIAHRVVEGPGQAMMNDIRREFADLVQRNETVTAIAAGNPNTVSTEAIREKMSDLRHTSLEAFDRNAELLRDDLLVRLERAKATFISSAVEALQSHIDVYGEIDTWRHEPTGLRMMMKSSYTNAIARLRRIGAETLESVSDEVLDILQFDLDRYQDTASVEFPEQPRHRAPTALARTLSLDLEGPWWRRFWKGGRKNVATKRYQSVIEAETAPLIEELMRDFFDDAAHRTRKIALDYLADQEAFIEAILDCDGGEKKSKRTAA